MTSLIADADRLPVQTGGNAWFKRLNGTIPRILGEAAWEGYDADGHGGQSCQRVHERGGFDFTEIGYYLARAIDEGRVRVEVVGRG
jgi:hypothetical protein